MTGPNKFEWLRGVYAADFKDAQKAVLAYIAVFSVKTTGDGTFCVRQDTLAEQVGVTRETVNRTIKRAKVLGFLELARQRKPGAGRHGANSLRLVLNSKSRDNQSHDSEEYDVPEPPESYDYPSHDYPETSDNQSHDYGQSHVIDDAESRDQNAQSHVTENEKSCDRADAPTSENDTPIRSLKQVSLIRSGDAGGEGAASAAPDTPTRYTALGFLPSTEERELGGILPPSRYCLNHQPFPADPSESCHGCRRARTFRDDSWPYSDDGRQYGEYQAGMDRYVKRSGTKVAMQLESDRVRAAVGGTVGRSLQDIYADLDARKAVEAAEAAELEARIQQALPPAGAPRPTGTDP